MTDEAVLLNTLFNIRGEPIMCCPGAAIRCFHDTGLVVLVMRHFLRKSQVISMWLRHIK